MDEYRILSLPLRINWAGWETDTYRLQQAGWQLSAEQDVRMRTMRIAINHSEMRMQGLTNLAQHDYFEMMYKNHHVHPINIEMGIAHMGREIFVNEMSTSVHCFNPIDCTPTLVESKISSLKELAHFKTIQTPKHEVFLKEASMAEILDMALQKQEPAQAKIRERLMKEQKMRQYGEFHTALNII